MCCGWRVGGTCFIVQYPQQKCRAADQGSGSGSSLPGLVLLGEPLHPILELRAEVADQTLGGGRQALGETESKNLPVLGCQHRPHQ